MNASVNNPYIKKEIEKAYEKCKKAEKLRHKMQMKKQSVDVTSSREAAMVSILTPRPKAPGTSLTYRNSICV